MEFALHRSVSGTIDEVEAKITALLKEVGFGILTRIEADAVIKEKLGEIVAPYRILGACNPQLAHHALQTEPAVGVFLPCSVCLRQENDGTVSIWALNPGKVVATLDRPELNDSGAEAQRRFEQALDALTR